MGRSVWSRERDQFVAHARPVGTNDFANPLGSNTSPESSARSAPTVRSGVRGGRDVLKLVGGRAPRGARFEVVARPACRPGDARHDIGAQSRRAGLTLEPRRLRIQRSRESARDRPEPGKGDLRQPRVGPFERIDADVDRLEILDPAVEPPALSEPGEVDVAVVEGDARAVGPEAEPRSSGCRSRRRGPPRRGAAR